MTPATSVAPDRRAGERRAIDRRLAGGVAELHWQSAAELIGYAVHAGPGAIGRVEDLCVEPDSLVLTEMVIATRRFLWIKRVHVALNAIDRIDWHNRVVYLRTTREEMQRVSRRTRAARRGP
jgi:hypothetical protein